MCGLDLEAGGPMLLCVALWARLVWLVVSDAWLSFGVFPKTTVQLCIALRLSFAGCNKNA